MESSLEPGWDHAVRAALQRQHDARQLRQRRVVTPTGPVEAEVAGRRVINFASNNYLGLTHHPKVLAAVREAATAAGAGSGAAALVSGYTPYHAAAEAAIRSWKQTAGAVLLSSGFAANLAAVQTCAAVAARDGRPVRFLLDKLAHASLVDAVRAAGAQTGASYRVFPHNGIDKLRRLLATAPAGQLQVVVTESIFSMDGDAVDLPRLAALKKDYPFLLLLDEAHGTGVYGPGGAGYAAEIGLSDVVDVSVLTLSKAAGVAGGAVCGSAAFCEAVVNFGRAYIYTTNLPPAVAAGIAAAVGVMQAEPGVQSLVRRTAADVRQRLGTAGFTLPPGDSPIVPIMLGDEAAALKGGEALLDAGFLVGAIRPPTVARGTSRLRLTLSAAHTQTQVDGLLDQLLRLDLPRHLPQDVRCD